MLFFYTKLRALATLKLVAVRKLLPYTNFLYLNNPSSEPYYTFLIQLHQQYDCTENILSTYYEKEAIKTLSQVYFEHWQDIKNNKN